MASSKKDEIWQVLIDCVDRLFSDEGRAVPALTPEARIDSDLEISSLSLVHLLLSLEDRMGQAFEFEKIALRDGEYRKDLTLGELRDFLAESDEQTGMFDPGRSH